MVLEEVCRSLDRGCDVFALMGVEGLVEVLVIDLVVMLALRPELTTLDGGPRSISSASISFTSSVLTPLLNALRYLFCSSLPENLTLDSPSSSNVSNSGR